VGTGSGGSRPEDAGDFGARGRGGAYQAFFAGLFSLGASWPTSVSRYSQAGGNGVPDAAILCFCNCSSYRSERRARRLVQPLLPLRRIVKMRSACFWGSTMRCPTDRCSASAIGSFAFGRGLTGRTATQLAWGGALVMLVSGLGRSPGAHHLPDLSLRRRARIDPRPLPAVRRVGDDSRTGGRPGPCASRAWFGSFIFGSLFSWRTGRRRLNRWRRAGLHQFSGEPRSGGVHPAVRMVQGYAWLLHLGFAFSVRSLPQRSWRGGGAWGRGARLISRRELGNYFFCI